MRIGLISDTHGLLRPEATAALRGVDLIVHAGDVGAEAILNELRELAPVAAVRGNVDREPWANRLPETTVVEAGEVFLYVIHDVKQMDLEPAGGGFSAVISGHSHRPLIERRGGVLYVNPGSAGPRRFSLPVTVATLRVEGRSIEAELVDLGV